MTLKQDHALIQNIPEAFRDQARQMIFRLNGLGANQAQKRMIIDSVQDMIRNYSSSAAGALDSLYSLLSNKAFRLGMIGTVQRITEQGGRTSSEAISHLESIISNDKYRHTMFTTVALIAKSSGKDVASALGALDLIFRNHAINIYVLEAARAGSYHAKEDSGEALMCLNNILGNPGFERLNWAFPDMFGRFVSAAVNSAPDVEHMSLRALSSLFANRGFSSSQFTRATAERFGDMVSSLISKTAKLGAYDSLEMLSAMLTNPNMVSMDERLVGVVASLMETAVAIGRSVVPSKTSAVLAAFYQGVGEGAVMVSPPSKPDLSEKGGKKPVLTEKGPPLPEKAKKLPPVISRLYEYGIEMMMGMVRNPHLEIDDFDKEEGFLGVLVAKPEDMMVRELERAQRLELLSQIIGPKTSRDTVEVMRSAARGGKAPREWLGCFSAIIGNANFRYEMRQKGFAKRVLALLELVGKNSGRPGILTLERLFRQEKFSPEIFSLIGPMAEKAGKRTNSALIILAHYFESPNFSAKAVDAAFADMIAGLVKSTAPDLLTHLEKDIREVFFAKNFMVDMLGKDGIITIMAKNGIGLGNLASILDSGYYSRSVLAMATTIARDSEYPDEGFFSFVTFLGEQPAQARGTAAASSAIERRLSQMNHFIAAGKLDPTFGLEVFKAVTSNMWPDFNKIVDDNAAMAKLAKALRTLQRSGMTLEGLSMIASIIKGLPSKELLDRMLPMLTRIAQRAGRNSDYVLRFLAMNARPAEYEDDLEMLGENLDYLCDIVNVIAGHAGSPSEALDMFAMVNVFAVGKKYFDSLTLGEKMGLLTTSREAGAKMIIEFINALAEGAGDKKGAVLAYVFFNINSPEIVLPKSADEARILGRQLSRRLSL